MIWKLVLALLLMFAGGLATSYAEKRFAYSLWDTFRVKVLRRKP